VVSPGEPNVPAGGREFDDFNDFDLYEEEEEEEVYMNEI
jgi:hypothetical protein